MERIQKVLGKYLDSAMKVPNKSTTKLQGKYMKSFKKVRLLGKVMGHYQESTKKD